MTEKRFTPSGIWIKDNYIDKLLNIDFNTITDRNLCCDLLNQIEDEKKMNGKIATKYFEENEQLKKENKHLRCTIESNSQDDYIDYLEKQNERLKETINEVKTDEKQLSISFMDYKMQLIEVLQQNYNYAYSQRQKNLDKSIVAKTYEVLAQTVYHIAETMNVDIERFPRDGDVE